MAYWNQGGADFSNLTPALTPEQMGNNPEPEGFFESIPDALAAGSVNFGNAFWLGTVGTPAIAVDWVTSKLTGKETTQEQDIVFRDIIDPGIQYANSLGQQERTMAGSLTFGIGKVLTEFASGGAGAMAVSEFSSRATSEVLAGKSAFDANMLALNQAAFAYAGAALPGALGGSLLTKAASGSGINVATGITQRAVEKGILYSQDDARLADYKIFDPTEIVIDMVLGAAFGVLEPTRAGKKLDAPSDRAVDAALLVDRARFEDAQIHVRTPEIEVRVERGINEQVRAMTEGRPFTPERLPDAVTMPSRDGLFAKVGSGAYRENLRAWMGDSKVVDAQGKPLVMYHGTTADFDAFDNSKTGANDRGLWGRGHYFASSPTSANSYALRQGDGARVIPAYISIQNPLVLRTGSDLVTRLPDGTNTRELIGTNLDGAKIKAVALDGGHDGVVQIKPDGSIGDVVAFEPAQIKSAIGNSGRFDLGSGSLTDLVDATELDAKLENLPADEIAAALGIKPDPEYKAFQQEIAESRAFVDLELPMIEDVDPATVAQVRKTAQEIEATGRVVDDAEVVAADDYVSRVKSIGNIMGCMLRLGA